MPARLGAGAEADGRVSLVWHNIQSKMIKIYQNEIQIGGMGLNTLHGLW